MRLARELDAGTVEPLELPRWLADEFEAGVLLPIQTVATREPSPARRLLAAIVRQAIHDVARLDERARGVGVAALGDGWTIHEGARALRWLLDEGGRWARAVPLEMACAGAGLSPAAVRVEIRERLDLAAIGRLAVRHARRSAADGEPPADQPRDLEWLAATARLEGWE